MTWPDGKKYEGEFKDDVRHGHGTNKTSSEEHVGNFENGNATGHGKRTWTSGQWYEGEFLNGTCDGQGKMYWPTG